MFRARLQHILSLILQMIHIQCIFIFTVFGIAVKCKDKDCQLSHLQYDPSRTFPLKVTPTSYSEPEEQIAFRCKAAAL